MAIGKHLRKLLALPLLFALVAAAGPAFSATKIMALGDSITGSPGCWRAYLWRSLQSNGYTNLDMVGTLPAPGCGFSYDGNNEGHGGYLATNIANQSLLPGWLSSTKPDIVLMHLGTNDVWNGRSTSSILSAYTTLVQQMRASNPKMKIIVAKIIPMDSSRSCAQCANDVIALDNAIPGWANGLSTTASPISIVDQWSGFSAVSDTLDGVHPTDAGHQKMANKMYPVLKAVLDGASTPTTAQQCNVYGTLYAICANTSSGWGWENNASCYARKDCAALPAPSGIVNPPALCNVYGKSYPICANTTSGWGWESSTSCIARNDCAALPSPSGVVVTPTQCNWYGKTFPLCQKSSTGWGWENNASCVGLTDCSQLKSPSGPY